MIENLSGKKEEVCVVGLGFVGITLSAALLKKGVKVIGVETSPRIRETLKQGRLHVHEPGVTEIIRSEIDHSFIVTDKLPRQIGDVIICVGTPFDRHIDAPDLSDLLAVVERIAERVSEDSLIVIRSTVPVGTTKESIYPLLLKKIQNPKLVYAPERTIQGNALQELITLPQIIGACDETYFQEARQLFDQLGVKSIRLDSWDSAELAKLACNAHTDMLYGFGNELAFVCEALGLDAREIISAANEGYPRPRIHFPGYVGGSCLTKDPYHLIHANASKGYEPMIVPNVRKLNESVPIRIMERISNLIQRSDRTWSNLSVFVSGLAYKGKPETDDIRGNAASEIIHYLVNNRTKNIWVHDFVISQNTIEGLGLNYKAFEEGMSQADIVILLNNHSRYRDYEYLVNNLKNKDVIIYDLWANYRHLKNNMGQANILTLGDGLN
jgi:UDP-N-acetyl-D-mannosaminuronic acid dehydrogenase